MIAPPMSDTTLLIREGSSWNSAWVPFVVEIAAQPSGSAFSPAPLPWPHPAAYRTDDLARAFLFQRDSERVTGGSWFFAITGIISVSALAVSLVNLLVTLIIPPRALPRLDFSQGIPAVHRTMVIVPTLLSSLQEIDDLLEALEIRYLGNRDPNLFFALLTDFRDAPEQTRPDDEALLAYARAASSGTQEPTMRIVRAFSICFTDPGCGIHTNGYGWDMSASVANWSSSMHCCGEKGKLHSRRLSVISPSSLRSSTSSPWIPTRNCPVTLPVH